MGCLQLLKDARNRRELSELLGYSPKSLSYIVYVTSESEKYNTFKIPKKNGGIREIKSPEKKLKQLQKKLSEILSICYKEIYPKNKYKSLSHGFKKDHSIFTNAYVHKNRKYVFNIDLESFFPSINFGRVRGFFINNDSFSLSEEVATTIAKIACHENELPQGAPTSPIISNLIGHILDVRMVSLANKAKCTYSRYADDITFSTNKKEFPASIAFNSVNRGWLPSNKLIKIIERTGFKINCKKTSMQFKTQKQIVTGLVVNKKVNVQKKHYKIVRSMCYSLFKDGHYYIGDKITKGGENEPLRSNAETNILRGYLSHIYNMKHSGLLKQLESSTSLKDFKKIKEKLKSANPNPSYKNLYERFIIFDKFYKSKRPLIICEGKTDSIYLKCALKSIHDGDPRFYSSFITNDNGKLSCKIDFLNHSNRNKRILSLDGVSSLCKLPEMYYEAKKYFKCEGGKSPIIILMDNDQEYKSNIGSIAKNKKIKIETFNNEIYFMNPNLYITSIPHLEESNNKFTIIEDYFPEVVKNTKLDGKEFRYNANKNDDSSYGKYVFATRVIKTKMKKGEDIFGSFIKIFKKLSIILEHHANPQLGLLKKQN